MSITQHVDNTRELAERIGRPLKLMEVCGTHTMAAFRSGLRSLLPSGVSLLSGPGCPVCVTPNDYLDRAIAIAQQHHVLLCTFGDMLRVPGTETSLEIARAKGARVQVVYSPLDALDQARKNPDLPVVFLGVGFETTAPAIAWTIKEAAEKNLGNYSVLCAHKTVPPAMAALLGEDLRVDGFLCPGHVSVIIGADAYDSICRDAHIPCVVAGFEPLDMVMAIEMLLAQIAEGRSAVEIQYSRSVTRQGNAKALELMAQVFEECDADWRGLGNIPGSGLSIRKEYRQQDAACAFPRLSLPVPADNPGCMCGDILKGTKTPHDCPLFKRKCTPASPVGACMVSSEGTCAAYYKYAKRERGISQESNL